ncbi:galactoside alpha-(1,2)-fucosyltransferase 1-like [Babylonia areolata]|uniref:galactoside alpha-(1,2)-fucosyltransferase 1-like n=1 Tax=Babylonia areolata TaxID=304850 RepID=UPI003FD195B8
MTGMGFHRVSRVLFLSLLALGLAAILVMLVPATYRLVPHDYVNTKRPLAAPPVVSDHLRTARPGQGALQTGVSHQHSNASSTPKQHGHVTGAPHVSATTPPPPTPSLPQAPGNASSAGRQQRPPPVPARFPAPNSSAPEVTVGLSGMLGNHMFQYASLLGIAHQNFRKPFCSTASTLHKFFKVTHVQDRRGKRNFEAVSEKDFASYDPAMERLPNTSVLLEQYLQSWKYFDAIRDTIKREFTFKQGLKDQAANLLAKFSSQIGRRVKVGVHVRRGDLLMSSSRAKGYHTAPLSYLLQAMDYMRHKHGDVIFIVVSDDLTWCRDNLKTEKDHVIADHAPGTVHLALLASCDHVIMTVGTYGWWGGYLSGGDVVYYWDPKVCLHHPPLPVEIKHPEDFFLPEWIPLPG